MEKFRYLPHTADMQFMAFGKDFREAIENSALALLSTALDVKKVRKFRAKTFRSTIKESADDLEGLVWYTLQDILSAVESRHIDAFSFEVISLKTAGKMKLVGKLSYKKTGGNYAIFSVKAVTPYDLKIESKRGRCSIQVVMDV
ncbi:MAG: archease [Candidatus Micrarchaeaceae archaeon]